VTSVARLGLHNERLQAETRAQLEELRASRARIVASGDAARQRLERDLHDGAQQRLVTLALAVRLARMQLPADTDPADAERLAEAELEVQAALADLRGIAHGIYPSILGDEGLAAALEMLAEDPAVSIHLTALPGGRFEPAVESAAYVLVAEVVKRSTGGPASVAVRRADKLLLVDVDVTGRSPDPFIDLEDRFGALGGAIEVSSRSGERIRIHGEVPCAS
jgi:signal transduction histidine kinase